MEENAIDKRGFSRRLFCVEYPGIVKNEDKMIETLGGLTGISRVVSEPGLKLGLKFRPEDRFCKSVFGHPVDSRGLLLKIKIRKKKSSNSTEDTKPVLVSTEIVGCVEKSFVYDTLCDFQYLPVAKKEGGKNESIHNAVIPTSMITKDWLNEPAPIFLMPSYFSRVDVPFNYLFRTEPKDVLNTTKLNLVVRNRKRRIGRAACGSFQADTVPQKPTSVALKSYFPSMEPDIQALKKIFEDRPIWSRGAIMQTTQFNENTMKRIIHYVAYFYCDGPWRCTWVRFGYDPKKDSSNRIYQILTYRSVRTGLDNKIEAYRDQKHHHIPLKRSKNVTQKKEKQLDFIFKPGTVPPMRFVYYQICDIHLPEVIAMLDRLPAPTPNDDCDDKNGFFPPGFIDQVREIMKKYVMQELSAIGEGASSSQFSAEASTSQSFDDFPDNPGEGDSSEDEDMVDQYFE
nr:PREDICTED: general transcription factor 3C polypeptide 5 [Bemisia tabaci]XP_018900535.1 PREDICTED: general transcription factor 3C polypeptide 5 [Bemisia tabaci]XP_018900536.1 PREDICTED: general transcription factor 3C polypeptide 5 [Bemisia tabaci]